MEKLLEDEIWKISFCDTNKKIGLYGHGGVILWHVVQVFIFGVGWPISQV